MKTTLFAIIFTLFVPSVSALDFSDYSLLYTDAPFRSPANSAGISLLTSIDAVGGYPDGSFQPAKTLNRAEFLKIVLQSHPDIRVSSSDAQNCFPDVSANDWFARFVCLAKKRDIVKGYPDGLFHPEQAVNYAESLKMLSELYGHTAYAEPEAPWYTVYIQAAKNNKTELPVYLAPDSLLTRGQMARLAAAYRANYEGELDLYRRREKGEVITVEEQDEEVEEPDIEIEETESGAVLDIEVEPEVNTGATVGSGSQVPSRYVATGAVSIVYPAINSFAQVGSITQPLADGRFSPRSGDAYVRIARLDFLREARTVEYLILTDQAGKNLGQFILDTDDADEEKWVLRFGEEDAPILKGGKSSILSIKAKIKDLNAGGFSEEMIEPNRFSIVLQGIESGQSYEVVASDPTFPRHQTTMGIIDGVMNMFEDEAELTSFKDAKIASFGFTGSTISDTNLSVDQLVFTSSYSYGIALGNLYVKTPGNANSQPCSQSNDGAISCANIPLSIGEINDQTRVIDLYGTVTTGGVGSGRLLQINLTEPGSIMTNGAIRWTDGSGEYNWLPMTAPIAEGIVWIINN